MKLVINGESKNFEESGFNVTKLLKLESVEMPEMVSVQLNGIFLPQNDYEITVLNENDEINFLYFMGGGA